MVEPEKPFACSLPDCGMTFTNEDHLQFHTKKHDMVLQLGIEQKGAFVVDQTPTPTRFIRNCEEMGLFQDLQNVNPFDEGFKRAMETKSGILSLENAIAASTTDDVLHTPQMVFPLIDGDATLYSATNNQRNITISRSSSDENGAVKEFETTTISKLTNEVTKISRVIGKTDVVEKINENVHVKPEKDVINETVYTNNVIKIHSNVEIRKENAEANKNPITLVYTDAVIKDGNKLAIPETIPPIMSQKSLDFVVDSLTTDCHSTVTEKGTEVRRNALKRNNKCNIAAKKAKTNGLKAESDVKDDYEVIIKLPNGKHVRMKAVDEDRDVKEDTKVKLKRVLSDKMRKKPENLPDKSDSLDNGNVLIPIGTLIPVTVVSPALTSQVMVTNKMPINVESRVQNHKRGKRKRIDSKRNDIEPKNTQIDEAAESYEFVNGVFKRKSDGQTSKHDLMSARSAASRRYRERLKESIKLQTEENAMLRLTNHRLAADNVALRLKITNHMMKCTDCQDLRASSGPNNIPQAKHPPDQTTFSGQ